MDLIDLSCRDFIKELSSTAPFPGGGGAAALAGAIGVALGAMAGGLSSVRIKEEERRMRIEDLLIRLQALQQEFLSLVDEDAKAFEPLSKAYKIPKEDKNRELILTKASLNAAIPPMLMMRACCKGVELLEELSSVCSRLLISDVGCGCYLLICAMKSASLNVFINTGSLKDLMKKEELEDETDMMLQEYIPRAEVLADGIMKELRK